MKKLTILLALLIAAIPQIAFAHNIGGNGILSGITHPLLGLDHLLAMVAVGVISTQIGGKAVWRVPSTFILFMLVGGFIGILGMMLPAVELIIALSVLVLGVAIAFSKKIPAVWSMALIALFAIFHGQAHGAEMPIIANSTLYVIGFVSSTTLLHISGVLIGHYAKKTALTTNLLQFAGAGVGIMGAMFIINII